MTRASAAAAALAATLLAASSAWAVQPEPWSDPDPPAPPERVPLGADVGFRGGLEHRVNLLYVDPLNLNEEHDRRLSWMEHRLRVDATLDWKDKLRVITSVDALDGVLWGDNGTWGTDPQPNSGSNVATRSPNLAKPCITQTGPDPLNHSSYGWGLCSAPPLTVRRLYSDVILPFGLLRIGRQPMTYGQALQGNDGDGRRNRFGFARAGVTVDRILFATKPLEGLKPRDQRDMSETEGVFVFVGYDRLVTDQPRLLGDDVQQTIVGGRIAATDWDLGHGAEVTGYWAYRFDQQFGTRMSTLGLRAESHFGEVYAGVEVGANLGSTREVAAAYHAISNDPIVDQTIRQSGARSVVRWDRPTWTAYFELDYASGSDNPQARQPLTQMVWAEDSHVGLLMFPQTLAFQSARAAAAGVETLRRLGAQSYPAQSIDTRGAFTNAIAVFPQFDWHPVPTVLLRGGVLTAWAPAAVTDPIQTLQANDGVSIYDHAVNFVGGKPGHYYGTELDGRFQWRYEEHFLFDLEGAILFPGDAFQDANGDAVRSVLVQGRTTVFF